MWADAHVMAVQLNIGGTLYESSVILFLVARRKVWLTPTTRVPCSNAAETRELAAVRFKPGSSYSTVNHANTRPLQRQQLA